MSGARKYDVEFKVKVALDAMAHPRSDWGKKYGLSRSQVSEWKIKFLERCKKRFLAPVVKPKRSILQNEITKLKRENETLDEALKILKVLHDHKGAKRSYTLKQRKAILNFIDNSPASMSAVFKRVGISEHNYYNWKADENRKDKTPKVRSDDKYQNPAYREMIFSILHQSPKAFGLNRTTWRLEDIKEITNSLGKPCGLGTISRIIRTGGFRFKKAKRVFSSPDPNYNNKVKMIQNALASLSTKEDAFFFVDEFGPMAVKMRGGRSWQSKGPVKEIPQVQKSKGWFLFIAALEIQSNQIIHFFTKKRDSDETIKMLLLLRKKHKRKKRIFICWDCAGWHRSKKLDKKIEELNSDQAGPVIHIIPLPTSSQFINVIESVFTGLVRAVLDNSNYKNVSSCKQRIDRYFAERNQHYKKNPKVAGGKIWRLEQVPATFDTRNNIATVKALLK